MPVEHGRLDDIETTILGQVGTQFKQRTDYGAEYFEGNRTELVKIVMKGCASV
jgi:hypothetical protein